MTPPSAPSEAALKGVTVQRDIMRMTSRHVCCRKTVLATTMAWFTNMVVLERRNATTAPALVEFFSVPMWIVIVSVRPKGCSTVIVVQRVETFRTILGVASPVASVLMAMLSMKMEHVWIQKVGVNVLRVVGSTILAKFPHQIVQGNVWDCVLGKRYPKLMPSHSMTAQLMDNFITEHLTANFTSLMDTCANMFWWRIATAHLEACAIYLKRT